jgi:hypothetical protein
MHADYHEDLDARLLPYDLNTHYKDSNGENIPNQPYAKFPCHVSITDIADNCSHMPEEDVTALIKSLGESLNSKMALEMMAYYFMMRLEHVRGMDELGKSTWLEQRIHDVRKKTDEYGSEADVLLDEIRINLKKLGTLSNADEIFSQLQKEARRVLP